MARPRKEGLDYFPHDTDAVNDEKLELLMAAFGPEGYAFYFILLERIYRTPTFSLNVSDAETRQILARKIGVEIERFEEMLAFATDKKRKIFDSKLFNSYGLVTSQGIKRRASAVLEKRGKSRSEYLKRKEISGAETPQKPPRNPTRNPTELPESKGKESKGKESRVAETPGPVDSEGYLAPAYQSWERWQGMVGGGPGGAAWKLRELAVEIDDKIREADVNGFKPAPIFIADAIDVIIKRKKKVDEPIAYLRRMTLDQLEEDIADEKQRLERKNP